MLVVVGSLEFSNLIFQEQNLGGVVFLEGFNLDGLLSAVLLLCIFEFSLHIVVSPCHQVLQLVLLLLELDLVGFFLVDEVVAAHGEDIKFFDLVLEHILEFLNMGLVEFVALEALFLEELDLELKTTIDLRQLGSLDGIALLELDSV